MRTSLQYLLLNQKWTPAQLGSSLALWLDADDVSTIILNGNTVSQWSDKSGNNRHATQSTAANQPSYNATALNGKTALTFNGTSTFLTSPGFMVGGSNWTVIALATMQNATQANARLVSTAPTSGNDFSTSGGWAVIFRNSTTANVTTQASYINAFSLITIDAPTIICAQRTSTQIALSLNGNTGTTTSGSFSSMNGTDAFRIGRSVNPGFETGENWSGIVGEVAAIQNLATTDRQRLEGYMAWKWGLRSNLPEDHPFRNSPPR